jgi:hypothetical protein
MEVDFQQIEARKKILETTRVELKTHFVGIDETIDDLYRKNGGADGFGNPRTDLFTQGIIAGFGVEVGGYW